MVEAILHWRLSSTGVHLPFEVVFLEKWPSIGGRLPFEVMFHWRSSSIIGCLPLEDYLLEVIFH